MKNKIHFVKAEAQRLTQELKQWEQKKFWDAWEITAKEAEEFIFDNWEYAFDAVNEILKLWKQVFKHWPTAEGYFDFKNQKLN